MDPTQKRRISRLTLYFFVAIFFMTGTFLMNVAPVFSSQYYLAGSFILIPGLLMFIVSPMKKKKKKN